MLAAPFSSASEQKTNTVEFGRPDFESAIGAAAGDQSSRHHSLWRSRHPHHGRLGCAVDSHHV
jgi:hypothetical protein